MYDYKLRQNKASSGKPEHTWLKKLPFVLALAVGALYGIAYLEPIRNKDTETPATSPTIIPLSLPPSTEPEENIRAHRPWQNF